MPRVEASERERLVECGHPALFGWQPLYEREGGRGRERKREREREKASECESERVRKRERERARECMHNIPECRKL